MPKHNFKVGDKVVVYSTYTGAHMRIPKEGYPGVIVKTAPIKLTIEYGGPGDSRPRTAVFRSDTQHEESRYSAVICFLTAEEAEAKNRREAAREVFRAHGLSMEHHCKLRADQVDAIVEILEG